MKEVVFNLIGPVLMIALTMLIWHFEESRQSIEEPPVITHHKPTVITESPWEVEVLASLDSEIIKRQKRK